MLHKNVVRYYACWVECVEPKHRIVSRVVKRVEMNNRHRFKNLQAQAKKLEKLTKKNLFKPNNQKDANNKGRFASLWSSDDQGSEESSDFDCK